MTMHHNDPWTPLPTARARWLTAMAVLSAMAVAGCGATDSDAEGEEASTQGDPSAVVAHCEYDSAFSGRECREYVGSGWGDLSRARDDCLGQAESQFVEAEACPAEDVLGWCYLSEDTPEVYRLVFEGTELDQCAPLAEGCSVFVGGRFEPSEFCAGEVDPESEPGAGRVYIPPTLECAPPLPGESPPAEGEEVCTQQWIGGCTEEGRKFADYASCEVVRVQRGYAAVPPSDEFLTPPDDPRFSDPVYQEELAWVTDQVEACGCVCCHSDQLTPDGPSNWYIESEGIWTDSMAASGLSMLAGWTRSELLGAYPAEDNNGFSRDPTGLPTTDVERLQAFMQGELERRGLAVEDFEGTDGNLPFLIEQLEYEPTTCQNGEGVRADGTITWVGGDARYLYLLEPDTDGPLAPPNLDEPTGTLWLLEVPWTEDPIASGFDVDAPPARASQRIPQSGGFPALTSGQTYYIYAAKDVLQPITRCLFVYE